MKAGKELDVLIDTKVMGRQEQWAVFFGGSCYGDGLTKEAAEKMLVEVQGDFKGAIINYYDVPNYSTDIAAAWEVVVKLKMAVETDGSLWRAGTKLPGHGNLYWNETEEAHTAPLAICLAALKTIGVEWTA